MPALIDDSRGGYRIEFGARPAGSLVAVAGRDGASISIGGSVGEYADLPSGLSAVDRGTIYLVEADGLGYTWDGVAWPGEGDGFQLRGPKGDTGDAGRGYASVAVSGNDLEFTASDSTVDTVTIPALAAAAAAASAAEDQADRAELEADRAQQAALDAIAGVVPDDSVTAAKIVDGTITDAEVSASADIAQSKIAGLTAALDGKAASSHTHTTAQVTGLDAALAAKADLVGGKIPQAQIPAAALTDYLGEVADESAMLALVGERGDWCTRTDLGTDWQLVADDASVLVSWREHTYPASPVQSVAGRTGAVTLSTADVTDMSTVGANVAKAADMDAARAAIQAVATMDARPIQVWIGDQAGYDALSSTTKNTWGFIALVL